MAAEEGSSGSPDPEQDSNLLCRHSSGSKRASPGGSTKALVPSLRPLLLSSGLAANRLMDAEAAAPSQVPGRRREGQEAAASWAPTWSRSPGQGPRSPRRLLPCPAGGYLRTAGQEVQRPPEKWQLALGTPWASAFFHASGELVGRTHYCLAYDDGMLPRHWAGKGGKWEETRGKTRRTVPGK